MSLSYYNGGGVLVQYPTRSSVIKSARFCCLGQDTNVKYQDKLKHDIQLTHQNYMHIEQENSLLNLQVDNLDNRLKDQDYQYACLKYELEQINRQKCDLRNKSNGDPKAQKLVDHFQVIPSSKIVYEPKPKILADQSNIHFADLQKLPEIVCVCGVQFKTQQNLKEHIKYYSNKANFSCKLCGIQKHGLNLLKHHMKLVHNVTYFPSVKGCRKCGKLFKTMEELHSHRRQEHGRMSKDGYRKQAKRNSQNILYRSIQTDKIGLAAY